MEGMWWYDSLDRSGLESQFRFSYLVVSRGTSPCAIVPMFTMDLPLAVMAPTGMVSLFDRLSKIPLLKSIIHVKTLFIGSPCSDEGTIGIVEGTDRSTIFRTVSKIVQEKARRERISMIAWKDFSYDDTLLLSEDLSRDGFVKVRSYPGTELVLPRGEFDDYLKGLKKSRRQNLKRKLQLSRNCGEISSEVITNPDESSLRAMFSLFCQTYERSEMKFEKLNFEFFRLMAQQPVARFLVLRDSDKRIVAFRLFFHLQNKLIFKFIGMDYQANRKYYLLFRLIEEGVRYALLHDVTTIQSGQTGYAPKIETGSTLVPLYNFMKHRNPIFHRVLAHLGTDISWSDLDEDIATYLKAHPDALP
jgi:predicted N-acyltransferase